jgi:hypothetical protein
MDQAARGATEAMYAELVLGRDDDLIGRLNPQPTDMAEARKTLAYLHTLVPDGPGQPSELIGWRSYAGTNGQTAEISLRYRYGAAAILFQAVFKRSSSAAAWETNGFKLYQATADALKLPEVGPKGSPPPPKPQAPPAST